MAVRPIDANELLGIERLLDTDVVRQSKTASWLLDQVLHDIQAMPTLTPPNEPRMINADKLAKRIAGHSNYHGDSILAAIYCAAEGKENDAPIRPIEAPPNEQMLERVAREYLKICGEDCVGDPSVGIPECPFFQYADVLGNGALIQLKCELAAYRRPPEGEADT